MFAKIVAFLHARAKAALIQPQSERESGLAGREPPQGNEAFCENRRGVRLPCRRCRPSSGLSLKPHPYLALDKADGIATLALGVVEPLVAADGDAGVAGGYDTLDRSEWGARPERAAEMPGRYSAPAPFPPA